MPQARKRSLTVSLSKETIQKAKVLAAKRSTSISGLMAEQVESLIDADDRYQRAVASAIARMERGYHLRGEALVSRDGLHDQLWDALICAATVKQDPNRYALKT